jgi:hypothetical protein
LKWKPYPTGDTDWREVFVYYPVEIGSRGVIHIQSAIKSDSATETLLGRGWDRQHEDRISLNSISYNWENIVATWWWGDL